MELFLYGDPRFLAGGEGGDPAARDGYERDPLLLRGKGHSTEDTEAIIRRNPRLAEVTAPGSSATGALMSMNEAIHQGKTGYHSTVPHNRFLVAGQWPSAGVELETITSAYERLHVSNMTKDLVSNWFHFERDGSLDGDHGGEFGFELITDPLPPRVYRDPKTWLGLENILSPWLTSFDHPCTGLHVHVGLNQFMECDNIPVKNTQARMYIAKVMIMMVYFSIADASFIDRVCLRKQTRYCSTPNGSSLFDGTARLADGGMSGYEFIDLAIDKLIRQDVNTWNSATQWATDHVCDATQPAPHCKLTMCGTTSHGTEINTEHRYTIEFRRAKGTLHALSIHRIVELMTLIVRYAGKCCRNPEDAVSKKAFYEFVHDNTTSMPLKKLVEMAIATK
jgi:hypothetical protein